MGHRARRVWRHGIHTNLCLAIANPPKIVIVWASFAKNLIIHRIQDNKTTPFIPLPRRSARQGRGSGKDLPWGHSLSVIARERQRPRQSALDYMSWRKAQPLRAWWPNNSCHSEWSEESNTLIVGRNALFCALRQRDWCRYFICWSEPAPDLRSTYTHKRSHSDLRLLCPTGALCLSFWVKPRIFKQSRLRSFAKIAQDDRLGVIK